MKPVYWRVPVLWPGETVAILGGGPSINAAQAEHCRGRARVIAINDTLRLAPWADVHYFCDDRWWRWHHKSDWYRNFSGLRITLENPEVCKKEPAIRSIQNVGATGFCAEPTGVMTGRNSGHQCVNLAAHLGAARIVLLGFDMRAIVEQRRIKSHWFGDHPCGTSPGVYQTMLDAFPAIVQPLKDRGIDVVNCTPDSALRCFRRSTLEAELPCAAPIA